jgi:hypothetical protein
LPCDYRDYPHNWKVISLQIRVDRARHICECTGECGYDHSVEFDDERAIYNDIGLEPLAAGRCCAMNRTEHLITGSQVVLTVAHLCDCEPLCANPEHCKAMCQRCHNKLDAPMRRKNAANTRRKRKDAERTLFA